MRWDDNRKPLADWITEGFEILLAHIDDPREGIPQERAYQVLLESSDFPNEPADAEYAIERLLDRGYFYKVDDNLRVTEPGDHQWRIAALPIAFLEQAVVPDQTWQVLNELPSWKRSF